MGLGLSLSSAPKNKCHAASSSQPEAKQSQTRGFRRTHRIVGAACGFSMAAFTTFLAGIGVSWNTGQSNNQCESEKE